MTAPDKRAAAPRSAAPATARFGTDAPGQDSVRDTASTATAPTLPRPRPVQEALPAPTLPPTLAPTLAPTAARSGAPSPPHRLAAATKAGLRLAWATAILLAATAAPALAETAALTLDFGDDGALAVRAIQLIAVITLLSLVPGLAVMVTCFPFMVTVFAILRQAIGLQQSPPNMLIVSLALFLTWFVMEPVLIAAWTEGIAPLRDGAIDVATAAERTLAPFRVFMGARVDPDTLAALAALRPDAAAQAAADLPAAEAPLSILVPSFMLSEIARAFQIGFLIFLPFLIIDLVVAAILMSMGMMMVPPAIVSLPFKLSFFVVADGWSLLAGALVRGYL